MQIDLSGMTAIVTGGSRGYGAGIAASLKAAGVDVWITGRDQAALDTAAAELGVRACRADVTSTEDWDRLVAEVVGAAGRLDILVNNAGAGVKIGPMDEQTDEAIRQSVDLNLVGPLLGCRRAAGIMRKQGSGIIVNISSGCAIHAWPGFGPYSAAKAGLNQFGHCLYAELREAGVRVTTVTPYWGATNFVAAAGIKGHPAEDDEVRRKCMQPEEMGQLVVDLCRTPAHLCVPDVTVQPLVQEIVPM